MNVRVKRMYARSLLYIDLGVRGEDCEGLEAIEEFP